MLGGVYLVIFLAGCLAFPLMLAGDLLSGRGYAKALFPAGLLVLGASTVLIAWRSLRDGPPGLPVTVVFGTLSLLFFALTVHALFFALPFRDTYASDGKKTLCTTGVYGMCRHPALLWFVLMYVCFVPGFGFPWYCSLAFSALNIAYSLIQDRYIFPGEFEGYDEYIKKTPFIIPRVIRLPFGRERRDETPGETEERD